MNWLPSIFFGLLTGLFGAAYGGYMGSRAVTWLRISSFEGGSGYFVILMILLGFAGGGIVGVVVCRMAGGEGGAGIARGFGFALAAVAVAITGLGGLAWATMDREPLVGGQPINLEVEIRLPSGAPRPVAQAGVYSYATLNSGPKAKSRLSELQFAGVREEAGRWIIPASIEIHVSEGQRSIGVKLGEGETQYFDTPIPARPERLDPDWSPWLEAPVLGSLNKPGPDIALAVRYRIAARPAPVEPEPAEPEPTAQQRKEQAFAALSADAPTEDWLDLTTLDTPEHVRKAAIAVVATRADLAAALSDRIASEDPETARDAMYLVGVMDPPPAAAGDAVKARIGDILHIARAIDPAAEDSRDQLYAQAHVLATGVLAAAHGLRRAGIDIRPELHVMADATREREKTSPRDIAEGAERIIAYFDKLDREAAAVPK